jgi:hypothetical protein
MMMGMAEDFGERDPRDLVEFVDDLCDDLEHNFLTVIKDNADDISCVNLVDTDVDDNCDVYDEYALTLDADS